MQVECHPNKFSIIIPLKQKGCFVTVEEKHEKINCTIKFQVFKPQGRGFMAV